MPALSQSGKENPMHTSLTVDRWGRIVAKAEVLEPGKRGGKFYRTERTGKVQYGEQPQTRISDAMRFLS